MEWCRIRSSQTNSKCHIVSPLPTIWLQLTRITVAYVLPHHFSIARDDFGQSVIYFLQFICIPCWSKFFTTRIARKVSICYMSCMEAIRIFNLWRQKFSFGILCHKLVNGPQRTLVYLYWLSTINCILIVLSFNILSNWRGSQHRLELLANWWRCGSALIYLRHGTPISVQWWRGKCRERQMAAETYAFAVIQYCSCG